MTCISASIIRKPFFAMTPSSLGGRTIAAGGPLVVPAARRRGSGLLAGALGARVAGAGGARAGFGETFGGGDDVFDEPAIAAIRVGRGAGLGAGRPVRRQEHRAGVLADMQDSGIEFEGAGGVGRRDDAYAPYQLVGGLLL